MDGSAGRFESGRGHHIKQTTAQKAGKMSYSVVTAHGTKVRTVSTHQTRTQAVSAMRTVSGTVVAVTNVKGQVVASNVARSF